MTIKVVHRADSRDLSDSTMKNGFTAMNGDWAAKSVDNARLFLKKLLADKTDVSKLKGWDLAKTLFARGVPNLMDISRTIKENLKDKRVFWVSTSVNKDCGGYATRDDYNVYEITPKKPLKQYKIEKGEFKLITKRDKALQPSICFDGDAADGSDSNVIAINSGPLDDEEISFLTTLDKTWIKQIKKKK